MTMGFFCIEYEKCLVVHEKIYGTVLKLAVIMNFYHIKFFRVFTLYCLQRDHTQAQELSHVSGSLLFAGQFATCADGFK